MKNLFKLFGTQSRWLCAIALVAVIGFSIAGCKTDEDDGSSNGTFTLNGIPSTYNGKYAYLYGGSPDQYVGGFQSFDYPIITMSRISNGSVSLPMWIIDSGNNEE